MNNEKKTIGDYVLLFIKGRLVYALAIIPFFDVGSLRKRRKIDSAPREGVKNKELNYLKSSWTYYVGGAITSLLIFSVPFIYLNNNFHYALTIGRGVFTLPLFGITLIKFFSQKNEKKDRISSLLVFLVMFSICLSLMFIQEPTFESDSKSSKYIILGLFTIGFFFRSYIGLGTTSLLYLSSTLLPLSGTRKEAVYAGIKTWIIYALFILLARAVGNTTGYLVKSRTEAKPQQLSRKAAVLLSGFIYAFVFQLKGDVYVEGITKTAQQITLICIPLARFFISLILAIPEATELLKKKNGNKSCA